MKQYLESLDENSLGKEYILLENSKELFEKYFIHLKNIGLYEIILDMPLLLVCRLFPKMITKELVREFLEAFERLMKQL